MNCRYYLADEPGGNKVDPKLLEKAYNFVKVWTTNQLKECQLQCLPHLTAEPGCLQAHHNGLLLCGSSTIHQCI